MLLGIYFVSVIDFSCRQAPRAEPEQAPGPGDYDTRDLVRVAEKLCGFLVLRWCACCPTNFTQLQVRDGGHVSARQSDFARGAAVRPVLCAGLGWGV